MKKIRVAFCLRDMQMGGVESVLIRTLDELLKRKDIDISIITYVNIHEKTYLDYFKEHPQIKVYSLYPSRALGTKLPHFFAAKIFMHLMRDIYRNVRRIIFSMRKFKNIDVFIDYHDFGFANELKSIKNAKKIAWYHSSFDVFVKRNFKNKLKYYDNVVVLTDACRVDIAELCSQYKNKIVRIYNPLNIKSVQDKAKQKRQINGKYFCAVSRLSFDKDIKTLLNGFDLFWAKNNQPDVKLVIVGDGDKADEYKNYAKGLKSKKQIVFAGQQTNPFVYMKYAMANVLSSYGEGLPTVLIESSALSVLNIASDCKYGPREILLSGRGGLIFEPGNAEQLSDCMGDVFNKKIDSAKMIKESDKALNRFDAKNITREIISLIS